MNILITLPVTPADMERFQAAYPDADFRCIRAPELTADDIADVDISIGNVPPALLPYAHRLRWLQLNSAGPDQYIGKMPAGAVLTNATGAYGLAISEHMLGALLELMKKLHLYHDNQRNHLWRDEGPVSSIEGAHALIVGAGNIGGDFGRKLHALGATVTGIRRTAILPDYWMDSLHHMEDLDTLLPDADIVALCLPGTPATRGLFNAERIARMKRGAFLVNIGRGTAIDTFALIDALKSGALGGAALDVTDPEPLPEDHPLWDAPNCIVTPHISGFYHLHQTLERIIDISVENLTAYRNGTPLRNVVDEEQGYRILRE